jgi:hypothetical protein
MKHFTEVSLEFGSVPTVGECKLISCKLDSRLVNEPASLMFK